MSRRPLIAMSVAYLLLLCAAYGTGRLWPVYVARLGGGASATGIFTAAGDLAMIVATLLSGWLAERYRRRKGLFYLSCVLFAATWWLMSRAVTWQQLTLINVFGGFTFGIAANLIIILTGLLAGETERGRSFGLLTFMIGASLLVGGLVCGPIADRWGFPALFVMDAFVCLACLLPGLLFAEPVEAARPAPVRTAAPLPGGTAAPQTPRPVAQPAVGLAALGRGYCLVAGAALVWALASFGGGLGRLIAMNQLGFTATAISLTTAIGGAMSLPTPLVMGWLSDRLGRKGLLLLCMAAGLVSLLALAFARSLWSFWGASALLALMMSAQPLLQALATDLLPAESVGVGLSLLSGATSAGLFGSALGIGVAIQQLGARPSFLIAALTPLVAIALLLPIRARDDRSRCMSTTGSKQGGDNAATPRIG